MPAIPFSERGDKALVRRSVIGLQANAVKLILLCLHACALWAFVYGRLWAVPTAAF